MTNKNELISVVVPVYNVEEYLKRCIDSILNQTYKNIEIILIDDGSTDNSLKICKNYSLKDKRIKVYHKKNGGLSSARNYGIKKSSGRYITFVDSDDLINESYIKILYDCIKISKADISCCYFQKFHNEKSIKKNNNKNIVLSQYRPNEAIADMMYEKKINNSASCKLYKVELFTNTKYPLNTYFEDLATTYKIFKNTRKIVLYEDSLYYYFQRRNSIIHQIDRKKIEDLNLIINNINKEFSNNKELENAVCARIINASFYINRNSKDKKIRKKSVDYIKKNRNKVLSDKNITKKTRYGLILSYISFSLVNFVFKIKEILER